MVMHDDTVTTSWRRLTDKVKGLWSDGVDDAFAGTSRALPQTTCAASRLNRHAARRLSEPQGRCSLAGSRGNCDCTLPHGSRRRGNPAGGTAGYLGGRRRHDFKLSPSALAKGMMCDPQGPLSM